MSYFISKYNNLIKVEGDTITLIPREQNHPLYQQYIEYLRNDGDVPNSYLYTEEEELQFNTPSEVALWKLRFVLSQMSLEDSITDAMNQLPEPQRTAANYIWNYGNSIDRYSNTVLFIQSQLQMTDEQVNEIFIQANDLVL